MRKRKPEPKEVPIDSLAYSLREAGQRMGGISEVTVRKLISTGKLKSVTIGIGRKVVPRCSIIEYFSNQLKEAQQQ